MKKFLLIVGAVFTTGFMFGQQINTFPHYTDFETVPQGSTSCTGTQTLPAGLGWNNVTGDYADWTADVNGTSSGSTGPTANGGADFDPGVSGGKYMYFETSSPCYSNRTAYLVSDSINMAGTNSLQFEFAWHMYGSTMGTMHIDLDTTANGTWVNDVIPSWTNNVDQWFQTTVNLASIANNGFIKIRIRGISGSSFGGDMAVDGLNIYDLLPNDAGVAVVDSPATPACNLGNDVWASVYNHGTDTLKSVDVAWEVNGTGQTTANFTGLNVLSGNDTMLFIGSTTITNGDQLKLWTEQPNGVTEPASGAGNDTIWQTVQTGLLGNYTIGGAGANYPDFTSAVNDLAAFGVCGPVVFNVYDSVFTEQIVIPAINGASSVNTITFIGDSITSTLTFSPTLSTANYTLQFDGADHVTFDNLTIQNSATSYKRVLDYSNGADWNTIQNCIVEQTQAGTTTSTFAVLIYSQGSSDNYNSFLNNDLIGGSYGLYWYGTSTTDLAKGTVIRNNNFMDQYYYGMRLYYGDSTTVDNNRVYYTSSYTGTSYGIYAYYQDNELSITNNMVVGDTTNYGSGRWRYGIYMANCDGTSSKRQLIANNMVSISDSTYAGTIYGIYMSSNGYQDLVHNSVYVAGASTNTRAVYATGGGGGSFQNNILVNMGPGYGFYLNSGFTFLNVDYNSYHVPNGNVGYFNAAQDSLTDWQNASGFDQNGVEVDPMFYSRYDLHTCADTLESAGTPTGLVTMDIDMETRGTMPDIGADEFATLTGAFLGPDTSFCPGDSVEVGTSVSGSFAWSTGDTTATIWVKTAGTYFLTATSACGAGSDNVQVTARPLPTAGFTWNQSFLTSLFTSTSTDANSYWWDFGDGNQSTQQNPTHLYAYPGGTFTVTHVAYNECGNDTVTQTVQADETTGIDENQFQNNVSIFPNPNNGEFAVSIPLDQNQEATVEIINVAGATVYNETVVGKQGLNKVNIKSDFAKGAYFVRIRSNNNTAIKKLIVE